MGRTILFGTAASVLLFAAPGSPAVPSGHHVIKGELREDKVEWSAGQGGALVALDDGVVLWLGPSARLRRWPNALLPLGGPSSTPTHVFGLVAGMVVVQDPLPTRKARQAVLIQVPGALAGVTAGGRLDAVTDGHASAVANRSGTAWASPNGASHPLAAGTGWSTTKPDENPFAIAPAPVLTAPRRAFSGVASAATIDGLRWSPVPTARSYVLRFGTKGAASDVLETTEPSQPRPLSAAPGDYSATVTAIDEHGLEGLESAPLALHVVGITLPAGATLDDDGAVTIADRAPLPITHAADLIIAYGGAREWITAPNEVRLFRGETTLVRIRDPRDSTGFEMLLRPRRVAVQVTAGPKRLVWPGDPVHITISATNGHGGAAPDGVELHPTVTLGVEPLAVEFAHQGSFLTADVPAPANAGPGPWVVRVQVDDQFGNPLGRDFVEIGRRPPSKKRLPGVSPKDLTPVTPGTVETHVELVARSGAE